MTALKRRTEDKITLLWLLKRFALYIGVLTSVVVPSYAFLSWYNGFVVESYNNSRTIKINVESIKGLNDNLVAIERKNYEDHIMMKNDIAYTKVIVEKIDKNMNKLIYHYKKESISYKPLILTDDIGLAKQSCINEDKIWMP
jgi:hypothetical protein